MTLKQARGRALWTQAELARNAGVDQQTVSRIERREIRHPSHLTVMKICRALGVDPSEIEEFADGGRL